MKGREMRVYREGLLYLTADAGDGTNARALELGNFEGAVEHVLEMGLVRERAGAFSLLYSARSLSLSSVSHSAPPMLVSLYSCLFILTCSL